MASRKVWGIYRTKVNGMRKDMVHCVEKENCHLNFVQKASEILIAVKVYLLKSTFRFNYPKSECKKRMQTSVLEYHEWYDEGIY